VEGGDRELLRGLRIALDFGGQGVAKFSFYLEALEQVYSVRSLFSIVDIDTVPYNTSKDSEASVMIESPRLSGVIVKMILCLVEHTLQRWAHAALPR
jgi:hypothetical protein